MNSKASILILVMAVAVLTVGCNQANAPNAKATFQIGGSQNGATTAEEVAATKQKEEELRLANERIKVLEEKAELEKQKREFAEQQLKAEQDASVAQSSGGSSAGSSERATAQQPPQQQFSSQRSRSRPEPQYSYMRWPDDEPLPRIGDVVEDDHGIEYEVVGRKGYCLKIIELDDN